MRKPFCHESALPFRLSAVARGWNRTRLHGDGQAWLTGQLTGRSTMGAVTYTSPCFLWGDGSGTTTSDRGMARLVRWQTGKTNIRFNFRTCRLCPLFLPLKDKWTNMGPVRRPLPHETHSPVSSFVLPARARGRGLTELETAWLAILAQGGRRRCPNSAAPQALTCGMGLKSGNGRKRRAVR
jgi:hypothetical protein